MKPAAKTMKKANGKGPMVARLMLAVLLAMGLFFYAKKLFLLGGAVAPAPTSTTVVNP